jgi:hypothetical protein
MQERNMKRTASGFLIPTCIMAASFNRLQGAMYCLYFLWLCQDNLVYYQFGFLLCIECWDVWH